MRLRSSTVNLRRLIVEARKLSGEARKLIVQAWKLKGEAWKLNGEALDWKPGVRGPDFGDGLIQGKRNVCRALTLSVILSKEVHATPRR